MLSIWKKILVKFLAVVVLLCLFFVTGGGISQNIQWKIDDIKVIGTNSISNSEIKDQVAEKLLGNYYFIYSKGNSYLFPKHEIETALLQTFPRLATVAVRRASDKAITIKITEREPFALWCGEEYNKEIYELNDCWYIDNTGFVFDRAPTFSGGVYLEVYGGIDGVENNNALGTAILSERFIFADAFQNAIRKDIGTPLRIIIKPLGEYVVAMQSSTAYPILADVDLQFKDNQDPNILAKNLVAALPVQFPAGASRQIDLRDLNLLNEAIRDGSASRSESDTIPQDRKRKLEYIDLRFNNRVIFGFEK